MSVISRIYRGTRMGFSGLCILSVLGLAACAGGLPKYDYPAERLTGYRVGPDRKSTRLNSSHRL